MSEENIFGRQLEILSGYPFRSSCFNSNGKGIPIIRIRDLLKQSSETYFSGDYDTSYLVSKGDILVGMDGDFNAIKWSGPQSLLNQRICKLSTKDPLLLDQDYLYHCLQPQLNSIYKRTAQTTVKHLSVSDLYKIEFQLPPLVEQRKIAEILSGIDKLSEYIKLKIMKLEKLKISLINDLIQNGIKNYIFKDSEFGKIPKSWDIINFKDIFSKNTYGPRFNANNYAQDGNVKTIRGTDILENFKINYEQVPRAKLDTEIISKHSLNQGDVIMITTAECGSSAVFDQQNIPYICSAYAIRLEPNKKVKSNYCTYFLQSEIAKRQIQKFIRKGTVSNLPGSDVMKIRIPLPTIEEQNQIISSLIAIDELIKDSRNKLKVNILLKNSLSQDLLSGNKRVKV